MKHEINVSSGTMLAITEELSKFRHELKIANKLKVLELMNEPWTNRRVSEQVWSDTLKELGDHYGIGE